MSVPLDELIDRVSELPAELEVVAYCRGEYCILAYEAVEVATAQRPEGPADERRHA